MRVGQPSPGLGKSKTPKSNQGCICSEVDEHKEGELEVDHYHREEGRGASLESAGRRLESSFVVALVFNRSVRKIIVIRTFIET